VAMNSGDTTQVHGHIYKFVLRYSSLCRGRATAVFCAGNSKLSTIMPTLKVSELLFNSKVPAPYLLGACWETIVSRLRLGGHNGFHSWKGKKADIV
jgi:hypothetical protein